MIQTCRHAGVCSCRMLPAFLRAGILCLLVALARRSGADSILGRHDWNDGSLQGWTAETQPWVSITNPGSGGIEDTGFLQMTLAETEGVPGEEWAGLVQTQTTNLFAGTWGTNMWVEFDFWASNVIPGYVQVRFEGDGGVWRREVFDSASDSLSLDTWTLFNAPLAFSDEWTGYAGADKDDYLTDLSSIDWIGVFIWRGGADEAIYGLDDFELMVPEPGEYCLLLAAVTTSLMILRKRRRDRPARSGLSPCRPGWLSRER